MLLKQGFYDGLSLLLLRFYCAGQRSTPHYRTLLKHRLINHSRHGFLKARSCLTNLLCFFEEITKWVDEGSPVDIIYLDFQKAFDKVPHQRPILKLQSHGIGLYRDVWIAAIA